MQPPGKEMPSAPAYRTDVTTETHETSSEGRRLVCDAQPDGQGAV